jgi:hypothetical protein
VTASARHRGHVKLARALFQSHPFWIEERTFSRFEAWVDLIATAAWAPRTVVVRGERVDLERGELVASVRFLAERWGWSKDRATRFTRFLVKDGALTSRPARTGGKDSDKDSLGTIYLLRNYDLYQSKGGRSKDSDEDSQRDSDKYSGKDSGKDRHKDEEEGARRNSGRTQWSRQGKRATLTDRSIAAAKRFGERDDDNPIDFGPLPRFDLGNRPARTRQEREIEAAQRFAATQDLPLPRV